MPDQVDWRAIEREATPGRAVGRLLRDQREARGLALTDVEKSLRIRRSHLEAIEEGRFDKLPGAAYIPAFLRAYAAHVDLDPEKVMTAYHLSGPVPIKRPVSLPADFPIVERRAPIGLAVLTVLLVVGAGYGVWHYLPREEGVVAQKVPPVPDRLLAARPDSSAQDASVPASNAPGESIAGSSTTGPSTSGSSTPAGMWPAQRTSPAPGSTAAGTMAPATTSATSTATSPVTQPAALAPPPVVVAVPAPPPPVVMAVPAIGQAQAAQPPALLDPARIPLQAPPAPVQAPPAVAEEATARQPASEAAPGALPALPVRVDTPVSVRINSWVELRGANGEVLAQTYVRAGESYTVPAGIAYRIIEAR